MNPQPKHKPVRLRRGSPKYQKLQQAIKDRDGQRCQTCGRPTREEPPHHVVYLSDSGGDIIDNMADECQYCHHQIHHGTISKVFIRIFEHYGLKHALKYFLIGVLSEKTGQQREGE